MNRLPAGAVILWACLVTGSSSGSTMNVCVVCRLLYSNKYQPVTAQCYVQYYNVYLRSKLQYQNIINTQAHSVVPYPAFQCCIFQHTMYRYVITASLSVIGDCWCMRMSSYAHVYLDCSVVSIITCSTSTLLCTHCRSCQSNSIFTNS